MYSFISLPKKILALLLVLLMALGASLYVLWSSKIDNDLLIKQTEIRQQNQKQYVLLNNMIRNRLESWIELFAQLHENQSDQIEQMTVTLQDKYDFLQLHWQVENIWLFQPNLTQAFRTSSVTPAYVNEISQKVMQKQSSELEIHCEEVCLQVLSMPLLVDDGELAVITISLGFLETLAFLNQSTDATISLVHQPTGRLTAQASTLLIRGPLAPKHKEFTQALISSFPAHYQVQDLLDDGIRVHFNEKDFLLNIIPMTLGLVDGNYLMSAHDITPITEAQDQYQRSVWIAALAIFFVCGFLFYLLTNSFRARLISLAERLPLLASQEYARFNQTEKHELHIFHDELDILQRSARDLATTLEALDKQVATKTSELEKIAMFDDLTGLPNRNMLTFQLEKSVAELNRTPGLIVVLFLDLDDFKKVNDSYGHSVGDSLLKEAARRLSLLLRKSDIASRFGGDEFVIMLDRAENLKGALRIAEKLLKTFRMPISINSMKFYLSTSIGIAVTDSSDIKPEEFIRQADIAMYQAKGAGGNCYKLYDVQMSSKVMEKVSLEAEAREALINDQFSFALQPQVELASNKLIGFEALLRWHHPVRGAVPPGQFIPLLENTEFMLSLGYWCIDHAFTILDRFQFKGYPDLKIAINLAAIQFLDPHLLPFLRAKLALTGINAANIELELTERTLVSDVGKATAIMHQLIDLGFLISIDDFGTGYSSLSYLKKMPAHIIKIDRSFVDGMLVGKADKQIVASTISMVQNLGMKVVAEGIEQLAQFELLQQYHCDIAQGFLIAKPIPETELFKELEDKMEGDAWIWAVSQPTT
jgi:diguanylate cyclase (GGDEF)-like protein